jgi:acetolactate synthase regulatory subunit
VIKLTLQLKLRRTEGALVRLLNIARRRGFEILSLKVFRLDRGGHFDVQITVEADRSGSSLIHQIEKLLDVLKVEIIEFA